MSEMSRAEIIAALPPKQRAEVLGTAEEQRAFEFDWKSWARPSQMAPPGDWSNWLVLAGRGFGKTRCMSEWVRAGMCGDTPLTGGKWRHIALISETAADCREVVVGDGKEPCNPSAGSGILQVHPKDFLPLYESSKRRLVWPNGATATLYNGTEPEQLRGPEHAAAACDELCKWQYQQATWDMLAFGLRAGTNPQIMIATTPRPTMLLKEIIANPKTHVTRGSTLDNRSNLPEQFIATILNKYSGTRIWRQEIFAEILEDNPGALWMRSNIDANRITLAQLPPLVRIVVAIDPAVSTKEHSDETGIIAAGIDDNQHIYVLDDISGIYSPDAWAKEAISLYRHRNADRIVAERNQGGDMVESTLRGVDPNVSYSSVWASRGKFIRAEPVAACYEQNRAHHVGSFPKLEDQQCDFVADLDRKAYGASPDRVDALVWAISELLEGTGGGRKVFFSLRMD
jgi:phage terminase large subunit-like protein